jgi:orotate phosphoribosyltransferase
METARAVAEALLDVGALRIEPQNAFTWSSGWRSPLYCDNRITLSYVSVRNTICEGFVTRIRQQFTRAEAVCGVATGGLPHGMLVADRLALPFLYVRPAPKAHGLMNQVEGRVVKGQRVIVIEDLVSTGESSLKAIRALREAGIEVEGLLSIFHYGFDQAERLFQSEGIVFRSLCTFDTLLAVATGRDLISPDQVEQIRAWRASPSTWQPTE